MREGSDEHSIHIYYTVSELTGYCCVTNLGPRFAGYEGNPFIHW